MQQCQSVLAGGGLFWRMADFHLAVGGWVAI